MLNPVFVYSQRRRVTHPADEGPCHFLPRYNCYKLLGFDLLLDADLRVHVVEVNARPQLLDDPVDRAVNRTMVSSALGAIRVTIQ